MGKSYYSKTSNDNELLVEILGSDSAKANGQELRISAIKDGLYKVERGSNTYEVLVVKREQDFTRLMINGQLCDVSIESAGARLIKKLGIDTGRKNRIKDIKAPMPGMVLKILVEQGQSIKKDDGLLVLEAMKMENLIKAPGEAVISEIGIKEGQAVEKGQLLIKFN